MVLPFGFGRAYRGREYIKYILLSLSTLVPATVAGDHIRVSNIISNCSLWSPWFRLLSSTTALGVYPTFYGVAHRLAPSFIFVRCSKHHQHGRVVLLTVEEVTAVMLTLQVAKARWLFA